MYITGETYQNEQVRKHIDHIRNVTSSDYKVTNHEGFA